VVAIGAVLLTGCGGASTAHQRPPTPTLDGCVVLRPPIRSLLLHPVGSAPIPAALVGDSQTVFVLTNESDENLCSWLPFVTTLRAHGYSALLYDFLDASELRGEVAAGVNAALAAGARHVVLMGASVGARASILAAGHRPGVLAVVSLSAEQFVRSDPTDLATQAPHDKTPTLLVSAREDPFVANFTLRLLHRLGSRDNHALILPGLDHGTALLTDSYAPHVQATILAFIDDISHGMGATPPPRLRGDTRAGRRDQRQPEDQVESVDQAARGCPTGRGLSHARPAYGLRRSALAAVPGSQSAGRPSAALLSTFSGSSAQRRRSGGISVPSSCRMNDWSSARISDVRLWRISSEAIDAAA